MWRKAGSERKRVLIVGGNFAGLCAASRLSRRYAVTLVDPLEDFEWIPNIHEILSGVKSSEGLRLSRRELMSRQGHEFIQDRVVSLDIVAQSAHTGDGHSIDYDACIVATGGVSQSYGVEGVEEHSYAFQTVDDIRRIESRLEELQSHPGTASIVIVGAGVSGIEALGELLRRRRDLANVRIQLLEASEQLMPGLPDTLDVDLRRYCEQYGVEISTAAAVEAIYANRVVLKSGEAIVSDLTVWAAGMRPPELLTESGLLREGDRWAPVNQSLQSPYANNVFVVGDAADLPTPIRKQAYFAMDMGECAADNTKRLFRSKRLKRFRAVNKPMLIAFGDIETYFVFGKTVVAGRVLAAAKEGIYQLAMVRFSLPLNPLKIQAGIASRFAKSVRKLVIPELRSLSSLKSLKNIRLLKTENG